MEPKLSAKLQDVNAKIMCIFPFMVPKILNAHVSILIKHTISIKKIAKIVHANNLFQTGPAHVE